MPEQPVSRMSQELESLAFEYLLNWSMVQAPEARLGEPRSLVAEVSGVGSGYFLLSNSEGGWL